MKKAIILAAGVGQRLGELTKETPKCLLPISSSKVLLDSALEALIENSIQEIILVTGFANKKLEEFIRAKWKDQFSYRFIFNDKFAEYNNVYSAYLAKDFWDDETILLNSDIIFHSYILKLLVSQLTTQNSFLIIDSKKRLSEEDMKVKINQQGEIKAISKNLDIESSSGEYIGIMYLKGFERIKFIESLSRNVKRKKLDIYYEDVLNDVLGEISVYACTTNSLPWTEIDTVGDYENAKKILNEIYKVTMK